MSESSLPGSNWVNSMWRFSTVETAHVVEHTLKIEKIALHKNFNVVVFSLL